LQAIQALGEWGTEAQAAAPTLVARLEDPEKQVAHYADLALWKVDPTIAARQWRRYRCGTFDCSVEFPAAPELRKRALQGTAHSFECLHQDGSYQSPTRYVAVIVEHDPDVLALTEEQRFQRLKTMITGAKIVDDAEIMQGKLRGRVFLMKHPGLGLIRQRSFWMGRRMVSVMVIYDADFLNEDAANYFLDSLKIEE
jgi:hypothetical protein